MRGPPPDWRPPRPPSAGDPMLPHRTMSHRYEDEEENYEDPETFARKAFSPFDSPQHRTPGNSYEISASQQRRSMMRDSTLQSTLSDEDVYLNQPPSLIQKNEAGTYFIPSGTLSHGGSTSSPHGVRYHDESFRCPPSSLMMADQGTALLHPTNKRRSSRVMVGGTPLPSTTIPPLSGSLKKRPPSRRSESSLKDHCRPTPTVVCLFFCLLLAIGLIVVLLLRVPPKSDVETEAHTGYPKTHLTMHSLPPRLRLGETIFVELVNNEDTELHIPSPMRVTLNASIFNPASKMAIMGKFAARPTTADHDFLWKLSSGEPAELSYHMPMDNAMIGSRARRNVEIEEEQERNRHWLVFEKFMLEGTWYLQFVNDNKDRPEPLTFIFNSPSSSSPDSFSCEGGCGRKGECERGVCVCVSGYTGKNCQTPLCPIQCSGKGSTVNGKCVCDPGFKPDCPHPTCNGNGVCSQGTCYCRADYEGSGCERRRVEKIEKEKGREEKKRKEKDDEEETNVKISMREEASSPSTTVFPSSTGSIDLFSSTSSESCSNHGRLVEGLCECERGFEGQECERAKCSPACLNGECKEGKCECLPGWKGTACGRRECPEGCEEHGKCADDGKCTCNKGWNGANCYQEGCGNGCGGRGECRLKSSGDWACHCEWPFTGRDCEVAREAECGDGIDNDGDGLTDCDDPDCCDSCSGKQQCTTVPSPKESIRTSKGGNEAGFMRYLRFTSRDMSSTLMYVTKPFDQSLVSSIRGRLVYRHRLTGATLPLRGARVSQVGAQLNGFTLTRNDTEEGDGIFDIIVNGGRAVELQFLRTPFSQLRKSFFILPNQIVHVGDVFMDESDKSPFSSSSCSLDRIPPMPEITSTAESNDGPILDRSITDPLPYPRIVADSRTLADQLPVRGTSLNLVYDSSRVSGAGLSMRLTEDTVDATLRLVHVHVEIAGKRQETTLTAKRMLRYSWTWNGLDAYGQKMERRIMASVRIGYEWDGCKEISWVDRRIPLESSNAREGEMGRGWTIDRHHRFDVKNELLDRGDGARVQLADRSKWEATTVIGTGEKRTGPCTTDAECNGAARDMRLANPTAVATGLDGSIYVVDHELIRKISPDGLTRTVMSMKSVPSSGEIGTPQLAVDPRDGSLHVVIPVRYQIIRVATKGGPLNAEKRTAVLQAGMNEQQVIAGTGDQCIDDNCGDEGEAREARLKNPKAIAFDSQGRLYVADDNRVRVIDAFDPKATRRIRTIGDRSSYKASGPLPCPLAALSSPLVERPLKTLRMQWPTSISIDQSTDTVYVVDASTVVYAIRRDQFTIVRGVPPSCSSSHSSSNSSAKPTQVAATPDGGIYLLEHHDRGEGKQILFIPYAGHRGEVFAGESSTLATTNNNGSPSSPSSSLPRSRLRVSDVVSMAVDSSKGGGIVMADASEGVIRRVGPKRLQLDPTTKLYRLADPELNEVYFFSPTGSHHSTVDLLTGRTLANFTYDGEESSARLSSIIGSTEKVKITRDEESMTIDSGRGIETRLSITNGEMKKVTCEGYAPISFVYSKEGLMVERGVEGRGRVFLQYSTLGDRRLKEMVIEGGEKVEVEEKQGMKGDYISIRAKRGASIDLDHRFFLEDQSSIRMDQDSTPSFRLIPLGWSGAHLSQSSLGRSDLFDASSIGGGADTVANALIGARPEDTVDGVITVRKTSLRAVEGRPALSSRLEWSTSSTRSKTTKAITHVSRSTKINGAPLLSIRFDHDSSSDTYSGPQSEQLLKIRYNEKGQMISIGAEVDVLVESERRLPMVEIVYDSSSDSSILRKWGVRQEEIKRDSSGRAIRRVWSTNESEGVREWTAEYGERWPTSITAYSGQEYEIEYTEEGEMVEVSRGNEKSSFDRLALLDGGELRKRIWQWAEQPFSVIVDRGKSSSDFSSPLNLGLSIDEGRLSIREWRSADGERHAVVEIDERGRVRRMRNGEESITVRYERGGDGRVSQIRSSSVLESFAWQSELPIQYKIATRPTKTDQWQESTFDLHYDDLLRVTKIEATVNGHPKESLDLVFDQRTTHLKTIGGFSLLMQPANTTVEKGKLVINRLASATRRPFKTIVKVGEIMAEVKIIRDAFDRPTVTEWIVKNGGEERKWQSSVEYDTVGRLVKMTRGEQEERRWKLSYDNLGRLSTIGNESIEWEENGVMERRGSEEYESDGNGWIERIGPLTLDFDSLGRLIGVQSKKTKRNWNIDYDGYGRVSLLRNGSTLYNLFYALPERRELLTHFTRKDGSTPSRLFHLLYTPHSSLPFVMREGEKEWALIYDEMDQLAMIVGEKGVEREIIYSPFGDIISDSNPSLFVPSSSFKGGIPLPDTGLIILRDGDNSRPWDARAGRFLSFPPSSLLPSTRDLLNDPSIALNPMAMKDSDLPWAAADIPDDFSTWLRLVDAPTTLLNRLDTVATQSIDSEFVTSRRLAKLDGRLTWLKGEQSVRSKRLHSDDGQLEWSSDEDSWAGLMQIVVDERNRTESLHFSSDLSTDERLYLHRLLSESTIVERTEKRLKDDGGQELHVTHREDHLPADVQSSSHTHFSIHRGQDSIEVKRGTARIVVHYGKNAYSSTSDRLRDEARRKWDASVWKAEKRKVESGRKSSRNWTPTERKQLIEKGTVSGYSIRIKDNTVLALPSIYSFEFIKM